VETVEDSTAARDMIPAGGYDVLVLDYLMPRLTGLELLRRVRSLGVGTPAVLMSGIDVSDLSEVESRAVAESLDPVQVMMKPAPPSTLLATIERMAAKKEASP
jgi:DNA-binding response OmpR family regulator